MKKGLILIAVFIVSISCEKVIDIPLNEAERKVVIEAALYDLPAESSVKLSKTGSVYDDTGFEKISGANVVITDDLGVVTVFNESASEPGLYIDSNFVTAPNRTYALKVTIEGVEYSAESSTSSPVLLDSLDYLLQTDQLGQEPGDTNYFTFHSFTDNPNEANYYRSVPFKNGEPGGSYLNDDKLFNGNSLRQPFFADQFGPKDTCTVFLLSMDEFVYRYFVSLGSGQDGGQFSPTPANPVTNIEGGVLGYFGAFITDNLTIIYP